MVATKADASVEMKVVMLADHSAACWAASKVGTRAAKEVERKVAP